jgi:hypothetical protein
MRLFILTLLAVTVLSVSAQAQKIEGVWKITEVTTTGDGGSTKQATQPSMFLFTKKHYSIIYVSSDSPRDMSDPSKMNADQLRDVFIKSFVANAGTYDVKAGKITFHPVVAKSPGYMQSGNWVMQSFTISGNNLMLTSESTQAGPSKNPATFKLTRVE